MRFLSFALVLCFFVVIVSSQYGRYARLGQSNGFAGNGGIGIVQSGATIGNLYGAGYGGLSRGVGLNGGYGGRRLYFG